VGRCMPLIALGLAVLLCWSGCDRGSAPDHGGLRKRRIAVIPKGLTHAHWKAIEAGARKAAEEDGTVEIDWKGPPKEDDTRQQIELVQNFVSSGIDGIILAPLSDQALLSPVQLAGRAGIPVVIIDSGLAGELGKDFVAYVGTDNYQGGVLAGQRIAERLKGQGTVLLLRFAESSASTNQREQGFIDTVKRGAGQVQIIDPPQYAGADVMSGKRAAENMLTAYEGKFQAIFCPNESSTAGMLLALEDRQLAGKVWFIGFDIRPQLIDGLRAGKIHGLVIQNPFQMGYRSVKIMVAHIRGEPVERNVDTGAVVVTAENIDTPEIQKLINPAVLK